MADDDDGKNDDGVGRKIPVWVQVNGNRVQVGTSETPLVPIPKMLTICLLTSIWVQVYKLRKNSFFRSNGSFKKKLLGHED